MIKTLPLIKAGVICLVLNTLGSTTLQGIVAPSVNACTIAHLNLSTVLQLVEGYLQFVNTFL